MECFIDTIENFWRPNAWPCERAVCAWNIRSGRPAPEHQTAGLVTMSICQPGRDCRSNCRCRTLQDRSSVLCVTIT